MVDARASSLSMNRSQYIVQVLRQDLMSGQSNLNILAEAQPEYTTRKKNKKSKRTRRS